MTEKGKGKSLELMQKRMQAMGASTGAVPVMAIPQQPQPSQTSASNPNPSPSPVQNTHQRQQQSHVLSPSVVQPKGKPDSFAQQAARHHTSMSAVQKTQANTGNVNLQMHSTIGDSIQNQYQQVSSQSLIPDQGHRGSKLPTQSNAVAPSTSVPVPSQGVKRRSISFTNKRTEEPNEEEGKLAMFSKNAPMVGQKMKDLLKSIDPAFSLDAETEHQILVMADEFVEKLVSQSFRLAKHRGSQQMEVQDVQLSLTKTWGIQIPGLSNPIQPRPSNPLDWVLNQSRNRVSSLGSVASGIRDRSSNKRKSAGVISSGIGSGGGKKANSSTMESGLKNVNKIAK